MASEAKGKQAARKKPSVAPRVKSKMRLDLLLVARGLAESRTRAQALIMAGRVHQGVRGADRRLDKAGQELPIDADIAVRGRDHPWVSRGGVKLAHGLAEFAISPAGLVCLDIGASTGGFTDVLLQGGAARVHAVDVGHGQLAWSLRNDDRVVVLERTNARHLTAAEIPEAIDLIVCDASFIGLRTVLPADAVVPIGWVAVGDPARMLPPDAHEQIWALQAPLDFPRTVFGLDRAPAQELMPRLTERYSQALAAHADDRVLSEAD